jgi:hypothetical protein
MSEIEKFIKHLNTLSLVKRMKEISKQMEYVQVFDTKGVQGLTGILNFKKTKEQVVFKVSFDIDFSLEHEYKILERINVIKQFCPHFVGTFGMTCLPISNKFISDNCQDSDYESDSSENEDSNEDDSECDCKDCKSRKLSLFDNDPNYLPTNILFLDYVSDLSYYKILKFGHKNIIHSQILMLMCALELSQKSIKFTHYDLHLDNILIKTCDENRYHIYIIEGKKYLVPTNGYYPVLIDMGNSYVDTLEGKNLTSTLMNYHNGLQPNQFDRLNDVHHLLMSTFDYLEYKSPMWYSMCYRVMHEFRHIPIFRGKGWKKLPNDISESLMDYINEHIPSTNILKDYEYNLIDIISHIVELPFENIIEFNKKDFDDALYSLFTEIGKLDIEELVHNFEPLFIIKELINVINKNMNSNNLKSLESQFKMSINFLITKANYPKSFDFSKVFSSIKVIKKNLPYLLNKFLKENNKLISDKYELTSVKSPIDFFKIFRKNLSQRYHFNTKTSFLIINSDNKEQSQKLLCDVMSENDILLLNKFKLYEQEKIIFEKL